MEKYPITDGGAVHHFDTGPFNWYVISQNGRLTVVDAGFPGHYKIFLKGIRNLGFSVKDVAAILLTHAHADHMGFAETLRSESGAPVFIHRDDKSAAQRALQLPWYGLLSNAWHPYVARMLGHAAFNGVFTMPSIAKVQTIEDGRTLDVPGKPYVLHVPGHTPGEVALFLPQAGILLSGDTLVTRHLLTGANGAPQVPPPVLSHHYGTAQRSLERMRDLGAVTMLPGHGKAWMGNLADAISIAQSAKQGKAPIQ